MDSIGNTTTNSNESAVEPSIPAVEITGEILYFVICLSFVAVCVVGGNSLVLFAVFINKNLRSVEHYFIVSLSVADILVGLSYPYVAVPVINPYLFSQFYQCLLSFTFFPILVNASIYQLLTISIDRYFSITRPFWHNRYMTPFAYKLCIFVVWIVAVSQGLCLYIWLGEEKYYFGYCSVPMVWQKQSLNMLLYLWMSWAVPTSLVVLVHGLVFCVAYRQTKRIDPTMGTYEMSPTGRIDTEATPSEADIVSQLETTLKSSTAEGLMPTRDTPVPTITIQEASEEESSTSTLSMITLAQLTTSSSSNSTQREPDTVTVPAESVADHSNPVPIQRPRGKGNKSNDSVSQKKRIMKAVVTLGIIVGMFLLCWLPYQIITAVTVLCRKSQCEVSRILRNYLAMLVNANSGINPIIYAYRIKEFRRTFKSMFRAVFCRQRHR
ncbi:putative G-protein coupled receptor No18 [Saccoglossus kowalevskii]|uniref:Adenosine receptor A2a-like n=1 Tax=Saccoglossus kowalevskii TaxID=10224 RepID=A0ABM0MEA4_SACKO|nr:PREDICTED: adenosine receptor A2a-like [Saccoglossus kowalevskii]